ERGISVLQLPLRNAVELAHRVQSVQAVWSGRLVLGIGSGSTRDDFELLGYDYDHRFRTFKNSIEIMHKVWNAEPVKGGATNAVLANVAIDLSERPQSAELAKVAHSSLICPPDEARRRLQRLKDM